MLSRKQMGVFGELFSGEVIREDFLKVVSLA